MTIGTVHSRRHDSESGLQATRDRQSSMPFSWHPVCISWSVCTVSANPLTPPTWLAVTFNPFYFAAMPWSFSVGVAYVTRDALSQQISQLDAELYPTKRLLWGKIVMTGQVEIASSECKGAFTCKCCTQRDDASQRQELSFSHCCLARPVRLPHSEARKPVDL